jgi:phytoene dehydrogenase-like protein
MGHVTFTTVASSSHRQTYETGSDTVIPRTSQADLTPRHGGPRITVVGGGVAGLTASVVAARAGARVRLLDARSEVGGRARTTEKSGFLLNHGAHALYIGTPGRAVLRGLGIEPAGASPAARDGWGTLRGRLDRLPGTVAGTIGTRLVPAAAKAQLARALARPSALLNRGRECTSMREWVDQLVSHPDARALVDMAVRTATYDTDLSRLDAAAGVAQLVTALKDNVTYLDGGWTQLVQLLSAAAVEAGVRIELGVKVASVSDVADADRLIVAVGGPRAVASLLGAPAAVVDAWAGAEEVAATTLDLGLRRIPVAKRRTILAVDAPIYVSAHTPAARLVAGSADVVHVVRYGEPVADAREQLETHLDWVQPGWRDEVVVARFGQRRVVAHDRPRVGVGLAGRPGVVVPGEADVFVAGDWVGPTGMLADASICSARDAALAAVG